METAIKCILQTAKFRKADNEMKRKIKPFDIQKAKRFLENREKKKGEQREKERKEIFAKVIDSLKALFSNNLVEVYLVGSILQPYMFYTHSDVIAKGFENHIEDFSASHKELLNRLRLAISNIRPQVLSDESFLLLDKMGSFRHFFRHAYDCELEESELASIQNRLKNSYMILHKDIMDFRAYVESLSG